LSGGGGSKKGHRWRGKFVHKAKSKFLGQLRLRGKEVQGKWWKSFWGRQVIEKKLKMRKSVITVIPIGLSTKRD